MPCFWLCCVHETVTLIIILRPVYAGCKSIARCMSQFRGRKQEIILFLIQKRRVVVFFFCFVNEQSYNIFYLILLNREGKDEFMRHALCDWELRGDKPQQR